MNYLRDVGREIVAEARELWVFIVVAAGYVCTAWLVVAQHSTVVSVDAARYPLVWPSFALLLLGGLFITLATRVVLVLHPRRPLAMLLGHIAEQCRPRSVARGIVVVGVLAPFTLYFSLIKSLFPFINPVSWDTTLSAIDASLHFGYYPHELVTPLVVNDYMYTVASWFYQGFWPVVCFALLAHATFVCPRGRARSQLLLAYLFCWIIGGTFVAAALNSGGPVFYELYTGLPTYSDLTQRLHLYSQDAAFSSMTAVQLLLDAHSPTSAAATGLGISAMPSMHISIAFLTVLYLWRSTQMIRLLALGYFMSMLVLSVALGWHYAIDGYVAVLITTGAWYVAGAVLRESRLGSTLTTRQSPSVSSRESPTAHAYLVGGGVRGPEQWSGSAFRQRNRGYEGSGSRHVLLDRGSGSRLYDIDGKRSVR